LPGAEGTTIFSRASAGSARLRFPSPTAFSGTFAAGVPLILDYRVAGLAVEDDRDYLLVEPLGVSTP
jgi:hypothetical protein